MITDKDIEKLKKVFATKDDLKKFVTKDDFQSLEKRIDTRFATKDDLLAMEKRITDGVADLIQNGVLNILSKHELRLDRLEKTVGGFPPL